MTHKQAVLRLLSDRKPHTHHELYQLGCVAHSRISDLRKDGHKIKQWRKDGAYLYQLVDTLDEPRSLVRDGARGSSSVPASAPPFADSSSTAVARVIPIRNDLGDGIKHLLAQTWPANRERGDFRKIRQAQAETELRVTICGFCGSASPALDGPTGRAWFSSHTNNGDCAQRVVA